VIQTVVLAVRASVYASLKETNCLVRVSTHLPTPYGQIGHIPTVQGFYKRQLTSLYLLTIYYPR